MTVAYSKLKQMKLLSAKSLSPCSCNELKVTVTFLYSILLNFSIKQIGISSITMRFDAELADSPTICITKKILSIL